ncbi:MAG: glutamine synthetase family protein [Solirubrobacteraceae bacterium]
MSQSELLALVCCDLGGVVRGRSLPAQGLGERLERGVGWVPANHALTPLGTLAEHDPFGSTGDLRLLPDPDTHVRVAAGSGQSALDFVLCDITDTDGRPWECCPRRFLREGLRELEGGLGIRLLASFEHEFRLSIDAPRSQPFSLEAQRRAEPFAGDVMGALIEAGVEPELIFPEFGTHQFEIPVAPCEGLASSDRAIVLREVVRELARRHELRASFAPLPDPSGPGNGVHIHLSLLDADGAPLLYDASRPACLSELGGRFAAGILLHARALTALSAPSPCSGARLTPHHWSAGAVCLAQRNREALLRIPPLVSLAGDPAHQLRLEYRGADAAANPYLALGAILRAGIDGIRAELAPPPILERDPAELDEREAARFGVGGLPASLGDSLRALADDETVRGWFTPLFYEAYLAVKRAELEAVADLDLGEVSRLYAEIY